MATDALLAPQASVTKTATFNGAALVLAGGTARRGLKLRVIYSAASTSAGAGSVQFGIDTSYDGGSTWNVSSFLGNAIVLSTTAASGQFHIPFEIAPTSVANGTQIRLTVAAISGTGATVTYQGDIDLGRP